MFDLWLPEAASSYARDIDGLMLFITAIVGAWFIAAEALLIYIALRFRRRPGRRAAYLPARNLRAMAVVLVPCTVVLSFDLLIDAVAAPVWAEIKETIPQHDELVRVTGEQWSWRFTYAGPDGVLGSGDDFDTVNDLHAPVDKVLLFELHAKDVLHSFSIPSLRFKQDVVPGRRIRGWVQPILEGRYDIVCAEICGFGHTMMKAALTVESEQAYREWVNAKVAEKRAAEAKEGQSG
jgi:cytochrome c oxidase subunit 2